MNKVNKKYEAVSLYIFPMFFLEGILIVTELTIN